MGERVRPGRRYHHRNGVYVVALTGRGVLLTFQESPVPEIQLPGGGVDPGEPPLRALHREVMEETGWLIASPRRIGAYRRFSYMPEYRLWAEKVCTVYVARAVGPITPPAERGHHAFVVPIGAALVASAGDGAFLARVAGLVAQGKSSPA
jgi:8-oxo-dGTP diphosphatase